MSSPLSILKKTRRSPLRDPPNEQWHKQKVSYRRDLLQEFQAMQVVDNSSDPSNAFTSEYKAPLKQGASPSNSGPMPAMMQQVALLEKTVKSQAQEIEEKEKTIAVLEDKLKAHENSENIQSGREELKRRCQKLQKQVDEMENFLGDYNLIWVGDGGNSDSDEGEQTHCWPSGTYADSNFHMNFDLVLQRIKDLNFFAREEECFVQTTATGGKLSKRDPVPLRLYSNGIVMFDGPFRSYQEESTQLCMQNLMDGYFPSELQLRFPDGVPFEVHDMRHEEYTSKLPWNTFPGEGQTVCGRQERSTNAARSQSPGKKLSTDQFPNHLPKLVVQAGQVIDTREPLKTRLQGSSDAQSSSSVITIDTPAMQAVMDSLIRPRFGHSITLKVKSEDGSHTYVVKMYLSERVGQLRSYLDKHRGAVLPDYDIISAYPQCCFDDDSQTLQSYGLSTNATLLLQKKQK